MFVSLQLIKSLNSRLGNSPVLHLKIPHEIVGMSLTLSKGDLKFIVICNFPWVVPAYIMLNLYYQCDISIFLF